MSDPLTKRFGPQLVFVYDGAGKSPYSRTPFSGYQFSLFGNYFYKTKDLTPLTRGIAKASYFHSRFLPDRHIIAAHLMIEQSKGDLTRNDFSTSDPYPLAQDMVLPRFSLRGYDSGYFYFGMPKANLEYHMPLGSYLGWRTLPAFLKRTHLNLFTEGISVDGNAIDFEQKLYSRAYLNKYFTSYGLELKADVTLGYYIPLTWFISTLPKTRVF